MLQVIGSSHVKVGVGIVGFQLDSLFEVGKGFLIPFGVDLGAAAIVIGLLVVLVVFYGLRQHLHGLVILTVT